MKVEEAQKIQQAFDELCEKQEMKSGFAYFASKNDQSAMLAMHHITDNELLHIAANIMQRVAKKHNTTPFRVSKIILLGMDLNGVKQL